MFRSALYEITHDYAILGEDSGEDEINKDYLENKDQPELIYKPINQHFQNFSKLLQQQKEKSLRRTLQPIDTNLPNTCKSSISPRKYFHTPKIPSVDKIVQQVYCKTRSSNATPKTVQNKQFYERQVRWLSKVRENLHVKSMIQTQQQIKECSFKPQLVSPNNRSKSKLTSPQQPKRKQSYTSLYIKQKQTSKY